MYRAGGSIALPISMHHDTIPSSLGSLPSPQIVFSGIQLVPVVATIPLRHAALSLVLDRGTRSRSSTSLPPTSASTSPPLKFLLCLSVVRVRVVFRSRRERIIILGSASLFPATPQKRERDRQAGPRVPRIAALKGEQQVSRGARLRLRVGCRRCRC